MTLSFDLSGSLGGDQTSLSRTLAQLSTAVQQLGQWENSIDITPAVLLQAINYGIVLGYDLMVQKWEDYYTLSGTFPITAGLDTYPLSTIAPAFYKLRHLDVSSDGSRFVRCLPHSLDAAYAWTGIGQTDVRRVRYRIQATAIVFSQPPSAGTGKLWYIPQPPQFASATDATPLLFDVPVEERLIVHMAHRDLLTRSDLPTGDVDQQIKLLAGLLRTAADARDAGEPFTLDPRGPRRRDRLRNEDWWP